MKFYQLANGQKFHYQDKIYTKVSPVLAVCAETGTQKFMRRADHVEIQDDTPAKPASGGSGLISKSVVLEMIDEAFSTAHSEIEGLLNDEFSKNVVVDLVSQLKNRLTNQVDALTPLPKGIKSPKNK